MVCQICQSAETSRILMLNCGNFDQSVLYDPVNVVCCKKCGHLFNVLSSSEKDNLMNYYKMEYSLNNLHSPNTDGDLPGSVNTNSLVRYGLLFDFLKKYLKPSHRMLDVGCAAGGFLKYFREKGFVGMCGIDPFYHGDVERGIEIRKGEAERIPYQDNFFDFVNMDQVVEHLFDPNKAFSEARRVLKFGGFLCVSVPDASKYMETNFFDFYWFLMREHIQHFDSFHLNLFAKKHGFLLVDQNISFSNMTSKKNVLPNMSLLFRSVKKNVHFVASSSFSLKEGTEKYVVRNYEGLKQKIALINEFVSDGPFYVFGIGREFFYLWKNTNLSNGNILGFVDDTLSKQEHFTVDGHPVVGREVLAGSKDGVLITATAHTDKIRSVLQKLEFGGRVVEI